MRLIAFTFFAFSFLTAYPQSQASSSDAGIEKKTYTYKTVGKLPIELDFFQKKDSENLKPVIIWIHGGALMSGNRRGLAEDQKRFYLDAGYSVASIDYRLAPETKLPAIIDDLKDAVQWIRRNGATLLNIDSSRTFVVGHSAGGYLALMTGYVLKNPPNAIISFYGYGDIQADWYSKPDPFYLTKERVTEDQVRKLVGDSAITSPASGKERGKVYLYSRQTGKWPYMIGGHDPETETSWFYQYCPLKNVHANYPPVLLIHGDKDTDVPFEQSVLMDQELTAKKIPHKFLRMNGMGHGFEGVKGAFATPRVKKVFSEVAAFMKAHE